MSTAYPDWRAVMAGRDCPTCAAVAGEPCKVVRWYSAVESRMAQPAKYVHAARRASEGRATQ